MLALAEHLVYERSDLVQQNGQPFDQNDIQQFATLRGEQGDCTYTTLVRTKE